MTTEQVRELPNSVSAEQALLGAALLGHRVVDRTRALVDADDFFHPVHGRIWSATLHLVDQGDVPTATTLAAYFEGDEGLSEIGGGEYLRRLAASAVGTIAAPTWARSIRDLALRRRLIDECENVVAQAYDPTVELPATEIAAKATASWQRAVDQGGAFKFRTFRQVALDVVAGLELPATCYPTGLPELDKAMAGGLYPGKTYGIAARKKVGKTVLAATISNHLNQAGVQHLFVAAEMGAEQIVQRHMAHQLRAYPSAFAASGVRDNQQFLNLAAELAGGAPDAAVYVDAPGLTFDRLRSMVGSAVGSRDVTGVILDYLQLVGGVARGQTQAQHLDSVSQWIADIGRELGIWWLVTAQLNQDGNTRGGEGIRLAGDLVFQLHRDPDGDRPEEAWLTMMDTRYTAYANVGSQSRPALRFNFRGPMFEAMESVPTPPEQFEL